MKSISDTQQRRDTTCFLRAPTGPGAHPAFRPICIGLWRPGCVPDNYLHEVPKLRMVTVKTLLPTCAFMG